MPITLTQVVDLGRLLGLLAGGRYLLDFLVGSGLDLDLLVVVGCRLMLDNLVTRSDVLVDGVVMAIRGFFALAVRSVLFLDGLVVISSGSVLESVSVVSSYTLSCR